MHPRRLLDFTPPLLLLVAVYVEFSNIRTSRWFWLLLAGLALLYVGYKALGLVPRGQARRATAQEVGLLLIGAFAAIVLLRMFTLAEGW